MANIIRIGGGSGSKPVDYSYTGTAHWLDDDHTVLALLTSGVLTITKNATADVFCAGGGGGGGGTYNVIGPQYYYFGGGGGGGYTTTQRLALTKGTSYTTVIGAGGAVGGANTSGSLTLVGGTGGTTSFASVSANGGLGGLQGHGNSQYYATGGDGGSGGGAGTGGGYSSLAGATDGGSVVQGTVVHGTGQGTTTRAFGDSDGTLYCSGGNGSPTFTATAGADNTGDGGGSACAGGSGIVLIRFAS